MEIAILHSRRIGQKNVVKSAMSADQAAAAVLCHCHGYYDLDTFSFIPRCWDYAEISGTYIPKG